MGICIWTHIYLALLKNIKSTDILNKYQINYNSFKYALMGIKNMKKETKEGETSKELLKYGRNLTDEAKNGKRSGNWTRWRN